GRYRQFLQCDADIIGVSSPLADAEILALVYEIYQNLGLDTVIKINDRTQLTKYEAKALAAIDKLSKIGDQGVIEELKAKGFPDAEKILDEVKNLKPTQNLAEIESLFNEMGYPLEALEFDPTLIRGLDYYTGLILEVVLKSNPSTSALGGGGRYDGLIGKFTGNDLPAIGYSVGLDRTMEAMEEASLLSNQKSMTQVLVTIFSPELEDKSIKAVSRLRSKNIPSELYLNRGAKLDKQLKYADQKGIPFVVIIGPNEAAQEKVMLKD